MRRPAVLVALVLIAIAPGVAGAAPCPLVTDPAYDDQVWPAESGSPREASSPRVDVTSADVVSDGRVVTGVVRVRGLGALDPTAETGSGYWVTFTIGESEFTMSAERSAESSRFLLVVHRAAPGGTFGEVLGPISGSFELDRNEVRITAPVSLFRPHARIVRGTTLRAVTVVTFREQGVARLPVAVGDRDYGYMNGFAADNTRPGRTYVVGSRGCVRP